MMASEGAIHRHWRSTKCQSEPNFNSAITEDALYRMTMPKATMPMVAPKRVQSVLSCCPMSVFTLQSMDQILEDLAAMFVAFKLVEAGAGGRQQDGIAGLRVSMGEADGVVERFRMLERNRAVKLFGDLGGGCADEQCRAGLSGPRRAAAGVIDGVVPAAEDNPE